VIHADALESEDLTKSYSGFQYVLYLFTNCLQKKENVMPVSPDARDAVSLGLLLGEKLAKKLFGSETYEQVVNHFDLTVILIKCGQL